MNYLANFITYLSLACGFASIIFSLENRFIFAAWAIIISVILDGIDGQLAKVNSVSIEFGKELDALVDVVSFGVAPVVLGYVFVSAGAYLITVLVLFIYLACAVFRLAKYNITPKEKLNSYFYGLPTTAGAGVIASFILVCIKYIIFPPRAIFSLLFLVLSFLMVSNIKYLNLGGLKQTTRGLKLLPLVSILLVCLIISPQDTIFLFFAFYLLIAPFLPARYLSGKTS